MSLLARALWIIISLAGYSSLALGQELMADFSIMETGAKGYSLVRGSFTFNAHLRSIRWEIAYPKTQTLRAPANPDKPTAEEEATLGLYGRYLQVNGFLEAGMNDRKEWRRTDPGKKDVSHYEFAESGTLKSSLTFSEGMLSATSIVLPDGRTIRYLFKDYKAEPTAGHVPHQITTVLEEKGEKTYKRLTIKNVAVRR
jgi:hypothetical protein